MLRTLQSLALITLCSLTCLSFAEVFTWVNKEGVREYGDEPPKNAQKAKLPALQSMSKEAFSRTGSTEKEAEKALEDSQGYDKLMIVNPKQNHTIETGAAGHLQIELAVEPNLKPGHEITLFLNGKPVKSASQLQFSLENLDRGSHLIHAHIKHQGTLLISTTKRRFHVQRPSIRNRSRAQ